MSRVKFAVVPLVVILYIYIYCVYLLQNWEKPQETTECN